MSDLFKFFCKAVIVAALTAVLLQIFLPRYVPCGPYGAYMQDRYTGEITEATTGTSRIPR